MHYGIIVSRENVFNCLFNITFFSTNLLGLMRMCDWIIITSLYSILPVDIIQLRVSSSAEFVVYVSLIWVRLLFLCVQTSAWPRSAPWQTCREPKRYRSRVNSPDVWRPLREPHWRPGEFNTKHTHTTHRVFMHRLTALSRSSVIRLQARWRAKSISWRSSWDSCSTTWRR